MAKFKQNHQQQSSSGMGKKVSIFAALIAGIFLLFKTFSGGEVSDTTSDPEPPKQHEPKPDTAPGHTTEDFEETGGYLKEYFPKGGLEGQQVHHQFFSLSYNEEHEQANWVAYELTRERLEAKWAKRPNSFRPDPKVKTKSASHYDYKRSGFDRGHLVPAADMAFSMGAIDATFYMSNISPQVGNFNKGIWRELEEQTRDWAKKYRHLYVVTGPVLNMPKIATIGDRNEVSVPGAFFKVILDLSEPDIKGIGYVIPNEVTDAPIHQYARTIDEVESITGFDFFSSLDDEIEYNLEKKINTGAWEIDKKRFAARVEKWNHQ